MTDSRRRFFAPASVADYRALAERNLPRQFFDYIDGGAYEERTMRDNVAAFERIHLRQRVLRDVSSRDTSTQIFGEKWTIPVGLAPVGLAGMFAKRAEVQAAQAAEKFGVPFTLSTVGICSLEEVKAATTKPFWFQLYMMRDRGFVKSLLERVASVGCSALVVTIDLAVVGARYRDVRNGMAAPLSVAKRLASAMDFARRTKWIREVALGGRPLMFGNLSAAVPGASSLTQFRGWVDSQFDPSVTWKDLDWIRSHWKGKLILKGILDADDAREAISSVAPDAIVISNHGGRQLDSVPSTLSVVPAIREAVGTRTTVLLDGGVRSGLDVVKAIARGADACLVGRPWAYAVAATGSAGVGATLRTMRREMDVAMALTGVTRVSEINGDVLVK
jgi:L-lactate dehydrogenase (cytochrome)